MTNVEIISGCWLYYNEKYQIDEWYFRVKFNGGTWGLIDNYECIISISLATKSVHIIRDKVSNYRWLAEITREHNIHATPAALNALSNFLNLIDWTKTPSINDNWIYIGCFSDIDILDPRNTQSVTGKLL